MSAPNRIDAALDSAASTTITANLKSIQGLLPFLTDLAPEERSSLPKMGDKSRAFVERTLELARQDYSFLPRNLDVAAFARDLAHWQSLDPIRSSLLELVEDTQIATGSEAYLAALEVYAAASSQPQADFKTNFSPIPSSSIHKI